MTSLLARVGLHETRTLSQAAWRPGKRKRQEWVCWECRAREGTAQWRNFGKQTREYSDDARIAVGDYLWQPRESEKSVDDRQSVPVRREWVGLGRGKAQTTHSDTWAPVNDNQPGRYAGAVSGAVDGSRSSLSEDGARTTAQEHTQDELWERFEHMEDRGNDLSESDTTAADHAVEFFSVDEANVSSDKNDALLHIDYEALLPKALERREADLTARCFFAAARADDFAFVRSLPEETFSDVLRILEPVNSVDKLASAHLEISDAVRQHFGIASMHKVAFEYSQIVKEVVKMRRSRGVYLTLSDYKVLLRSARDLGNYNLSKQVWKMLHFDNHIPDTECYNYYMAGRLLSGVHDASGRHKVRVIPFHMLARKAARLGQGYRSYRVGRGGVREQVMAIFRDMLKHGESANEESFRVVIMAAAREGQLDTVKSVLRKVWNIDVDALLAGTDESAIQPKQLPADSPLRPTGRMLFAIAHAFGINNEIPTALRLVDFVARHYDLPISQVTWGQLFEWTFVLSTPRTGAKAEPTGAKTGQLPPQSVMNLWDTMTGAPYHIQPTMGMYNHLIKNLSHRHMTFAAMEKMDEARHLYTESRLKAKDLLQELRKGILNSKKGREVAPEASTALDHTQSPASEGSSQNSVSSEEVSPETVQSLERLRTAWEHANLVRKRNFFWLKRWVALLLNTLVHSSYSRGSDNLVLRQIPRFLHDWREFASTHVRYHTGGGIVEFDIRTQEDMDGNAVRQAVKRERREFWLNKEVPKYVGGEWLKSDMPVLPKRLRDSPQVARFLEIQSPQQRLRLAEAKAGEPSEESIEDESEELRREVKQAVDMALERS